MRMYIRNWAGVVAIFVALLAMQMTYASAAKISTSVVKISWYGKPFHGRNMAGGGKFNMYDPTTLAHKTLPFKTRVLLLNQDNGHTLCGVVRDRGPYVKGRSYDVSYAGAVKLGIIKAGVGKHVKAIVNGC